LPDKLQLTLARIAGLVGKDNVGTPVLLNTHRPDAFQLSMLPSEQYPPQTMTTAADEHEQTLRLAIRLFRPALHATVTLKGMAPQHVIATGVKGKVLRCAGPWKTSGDWWTSTAWTREEWDVALNDGALYRIYRDMQTREWYVHGVYD
jgi:protein ImuB